MARLARRRPLARVIVALALAATAALGLAPGAPPSSVGALSRWTGGVDVYRAGVFTTQQTWLWCTAADVQIIRNIVDRRVDHSRASQQRYFDYMRAHDRYSMPVSDGTEPSGWAAGLRHYVDSRYRMVASSSFDAALRSAVTNLRRTNLPVGLLVARGDHAWVLTGFTATADPARTSHFTVTSVRVTGPLWGLQSRSFGYDMRPDTRLTPSQLRGFFTPWHYARIRMAWEGRWVSIQGIPSTAPRASATHAPAQPKATPRPAPATPHATVAPPPASSAMAASVATPVPPVAATAAPVPLAGGPVSRPSAEPEPVGSTATGPAAPAVLAAIGVGLAVALAVGIAVVSARSRRAVARE